jgi:hypothetical protein
MKKPCSLTIYLCLGETIKGHFVGSFKESLGLHQKYIVVEFLKNLKLLALGVGGG